MHWLIKCCIKKKKIATEKVSRTSATSGKNESRALYLYIVNIVDCQITLLQDSKYLFIYLSLFDLFYLIFVCARVCVCLFSVLFLFCVLELVLVLCCFAPTMGMNN